MAHPFATSELLIVDRDLRGPMGGENGAAWPRQSSPRQERRNLEKARQHADRDASKNLWPSLCVWIWRQTKTLRLPGHASRDFVVATVHDYERGDLEGKIRPRTGA